MKSNKLEFHILDSNEQIKDVEQNYHTCISDNNDNQQIQNFSRPFSNPNHNHHSGRLQFIST